MRLLQLIDSLEAGGAERMAVNYANTLIGKTDFSALVATRKEGSLKNQLDSKVAYLFLNKKRTLDWQALKKLRSYCLENKVTHVQAHSSSFFLAVVLKLSLPHLKIIWHDHYGNAEFLSQRSYSLIRCCSVFFSGVIAVNQKLQLWGLQKLFVKKVIYLPNFSLENSPNGNMLSTILSGQDGKRIVCLANLRPQKNHFLLLEIAGKLQKSYPDWTFHLVGKDFKDTYSAAIKSESKRRELDNKLFLYDSCTDVTAILEQCQIGILTSQSEGLPLALLEYGLAGLAVVVTDVGEISAIVQNNENGVLLTAADGDAFVAALEKLITDVSLRQKFSSNLRQTVEQEFSAAVVIRQYLQWLQQL